MDFNNDISFLYVVYVYVVQIISNFQSKNKKVAALL